STCFMVLEFSSACRRFACTDTSFLALKQIVCAGRRLIREQRPPRIEEGPTDGIDGEDAGEHEQGGVPTPGALLQRPCDKVQHRSPEIPGHIHDAENRRDALAAKLDGDSVTADAAEGRDKAAEAE